MGARRENNMVSGDGVDIVDWRIKRRRKRGEAAILHRFYLAS
jgi:hypothetical protein